MASVSHQMLMASQIPALALTYKGHGSNHGDPFDVTNARKLAYGTVLGGSAPAAGDLVCFLLGGGTESNDATAANRFVRITIGNGWTQANSPAISAVGNSSFSPVSMAAKVVQASDISSPPDWFFAGSGTNGFVATHSFWIAYSVVGVITSVTIPSFQTNNGGNSAPANVAVDSSALNPPAAAITMAGAFGSDGSISLSGITLDFEETKNDWGEYYTGGEDSRMGAKLDVGGASYTLSKGDDGSGNYLSGGYVSVS